MLRIWKYVLPDNTDYPTARIPKGGKILHFKYINKVPCIWAFVNVELQEEDRKFWIVESGQVININPKFLYYIGSDSFETNAGLYTGHLFELVVQNKGNLPNII